MLRRAAENLVWIGRYLERAESALRVIEAECLLSLDHDRDPAVTWKALFTALGDPSAGGQGLFGSRDRAVHWLLLEPGNPNSVLSCLQSARENARVLRDLFPGRLMDQANRLQAILLAELNEPAASLNEMLEELARSLAAWHGLAEGSLSRDETWHLLHLGGMLERADQTSRLLDANVLLIQDPGLGLGGSMEAPWRDLLQIASGLEMYRRKAGAVEPERVVRFLMLDGQFPRSMKHCLAEALKSLEALPWGAVSEAARRLGALHAQMAFWSPSEPVLPGLHERLDALQLGLIQVGDALGEGLFNPFAGEDPALPSPRGDRMEAQQQ
jgi:uncharacterized alpha-E superfamily protein